MSRLTTAQAVREVGRPIFTTREIANLTGSPVSVTTRVLSHMERDGFLTRVRRGIWCNSHDPRFTPYALVPFLVGGNRAYVSFVSALHLHGLIEQIPRVIYAATTGPTRVKQTPVATFSFHRIDPAIFTGFEWYGDGRDFLVATREKALVDSLYLSSRKGNRFRFLPELSIGREFSFDRAEYFVSSIPNRLIRISVLHRLRELTGRDSKRRAI